MTRAECEQGGSQSNMAGLSGTITDIHQDGSITASVLFVTLGTKVLLTWPNTAENLQFYQPYYEANHGLITCEAIQQLSGLKVNVLKEGIGVKMEPGMLHAVISP